MTSVRTALTTVPPGVVALGFVSLLMDLSSETIHSLLPVFMVTTLGAGVAVLGLVEGVAEATASIAKVFSGWLSDKIGQRKMLTIVGYGLAAVSKFLFPIARSVEMVMLARFADRIGKGIRGAPRDALIADMTEPGQRGAAFGLRQSMDTVGACLGPALAIGLMMTTHGNVRLIFAVAAIPAFIAVLVLALAVKEPERTTPPKPPRVPIVFGELKALGAPYWRITALSTAFALARFSEAFLVLRGQTDGLSPTFAPAVMIVMTLVYALVAAPAGALADRMSARRLLSAGLMTLIAADLILGLGHGIGALFVGAGLWGLHMALTQGLFSALTADTAPAALRGSAFGLSNLLGGVATLIASLAAGALWTAFGPPSAFLTAGGVCALVLAGLWLFAPKVQLT